METEENSTIPFLDTLVHREPNGQLTTTVYRKPTHTDQYLAYDSHHPQSVKRGVVKCLNDRATRVVTKQGGKRSEKHHISSALVSNGYPVSFLQRVNKTRPREERQEQGYCATAILPFVDGLSQTLRRCLRDHNIRTVFKSDTTLRKQLVRPKDPIPPGRQDGVVYKIPCGECDKVYIGETGRALDTRMKEHDADVKSKNPDKKVKSAVAEHAHKTGHYPNWKNVECMEKDQHWYTRKVKEAIQIQLHPNNINRDSGVELPKAWLPIVRKHQSGGKNNRSAPPPTSKRPDPTRTIRVTQDPVYTSPDEG